MGTCHFTPITCSLIRSRVSTVSCSQLFTSHLQPMMDVAADGLPLVFDTECKFAQVVTMSAPAHTTNVEERATGSTEEILEATDKLVVSYFSIMSCRASTTTAGGNSREFPCLFLMGPGGPFGLDKKMMMLG